MDLIKLLQEGDATGLEMQKALEALEHAKKAVEQAKERHDLTKSYFDQAIAKADEAGIPRAKFKKLVEERVAGLWNSGLMNQAEEKSAKLPRAPRPAKKKEESLETEEFEASEDLEEISAVSEAAVMN